MADSITCANEEARKLWARGWCFMINYNHEEATTPVRTTNVAARPTRTCAMAWWGIAYSVSSSYNWPPGLGSGHDPIQHALTLKDLIDAVI